MATPDAPVVASSNVLSDAAAPRVDSMSGNGGNGDLIHGGHGHSQNLDLKEILVVDELHSS